MRHPEHLKSHHLRILQIIDERPEINSSGISEDLGKDISTISYHTSNLEEWGYLNKVDGGKNTFFELTNKGEKVARGGKEKFKSNIRGHCIRFKFPIKRNPYEGFNDPKFVRNQSMRNWSEDQKTKTEQNIVIQINPKNISITVKEIVAINPNQAIYKAYQKAILQLTKLIQSNDGLVLGKEQEGMITVAEVTKQSYAITNEPYAKFRMKHDSPIRNSGVEVDASKEIPELEFTDSKTGLVDANKVMNLYRGLSDGSIDIRALKALSSNYSKIQPN